MARVFITGSSTGLGLATATALVDDGHSVIVHARNHRRAAELDGLVQRGGDVVIGDLASRAEVLDIGSQVNALGAMDAVVHNAGVYIDRTRVATVDEHTNVLAVNVLAPYLLTTVIEQPGRLIYVSSGMHHDGDPSLRDIDWHDRPWNGVQAYCDSKLYVTAIAMAVARRWPTTFSNAVDPGWVPTRMGGANAPDDLTLGHLTQTWLAAGDEPTAKVTGRYWFHQQTNEPAAAASDHAFQDALLDELAVLTGVRFPQS
jgi:NAD(P)-dependent dehydrogenase (short-subunit alcohol dehydrogenase family)